MCRPGSQGSSCLAITSYTALTPEYPETNPRHNTVPSLNTLILNSLNKTTPFSGIPFMLLLKPKMNIKLYNSINGIGGSEAGK